MDYTYDTLKKGGWSLIKANTISAASYFVCKDKARPAIGCILIEVDNDGTSATATDSYKLGHFVSMDPGINEPERFLLKWEPVKNAKLIAPSPKKCTWLAIRHAKNKNGTPLPVLELMTLDEGNYGFSKVGQLTVDEFEGNFPNWKVLDGRDDYLKHPTKKDGKDKVGANPYESPGINTSFLVDIFRAIERAVSHDGDAVTQILHRHLMEPMYLTANNKSGESALAICMPVRM